LGRLLRDNRTRTSSVPEIQRNAIGMHRGILAALTEGDTERSRRAMDKHMDQTVEDLETYVLHTKNGHTHD
jgi:GntR family transcriptional repressor for pyruvate dehydrogenase complex